MFGLRRIDRERDYPTRSLTQTLRAQRTIVLTIHSAASSISRDGSDARCKSSCVTSRDRRCTL